MLMTITNDSWYNESSGAQQHLSHVIFRAAECRRFLLRSGNNSHTCLIGPDGRILQSITDPETGSPFARAIGRFAVEIPKDQPLTFHVRHGDLLAHLSAAASLIGLLGLLGRTMARKWRFHTLCQEKTRQAP